MTSPAKPIDRSAAWVALLTNLFVMPGVGSWMAGQRKLGATHFLLSLAGLLLMTAWVCFYVCDWISHQTMPAALGPQLWTGIAGAVLFIGAWLWSLMSSLALVRQANAAPPPESSQPPKLN